MTIQTLILIIALVFSLLTFIFQLVYGPKLKMASTIQTLLALIAMCM
jgi:hypothetical protein